MRSTLYREKGRLQPGLPTNVEQINLGQRHKQTLDGRDFLLFDVTVGGHRIMCFCTQEGLEHFWGAEEVFVDGTFFSCPSLFYQLLTVSVVLEGVSLNVAYFLLPGKSRGIYTTAFQKFDEALRARGLSSQLKIVRSDYELALIQALLCVFPGTRHRGCHFHFAQAVWRKVQSLGLAKPYQEDPRVKMFVRQSISLAFVPPTFVRVAWRTLKSTAPAVTGASELSLYFEDTWLTGNYDISQWNHYQNDGARTNNLKEAWHR